MACSALYFLGGAWVLYQKKHVNIEMIYEKFSPRGKVISDSATFGFFAIYTGMMTWHLSIFAWELDSTGRNDLQSLEPGYLSQQTDHGLRLHDFISRRVGPNLCGTSIY